MNDFEYMEKYGEDETSFIGDDELEKLQENIDLNEKIEILERANKKLEEDIKELIKKLEEEEDGKNN